MMYVKTVNEQREKWIDQVKGFAILLMIYGHCCTEVDYTNVIPWITSFHMPIFFYLTGHLLKRKDNICFNEKDYIIRRVRVLFVPYFLFSLAYSLFLAGLQIIGGEEVFQAIYPKLVAVFLLDGGSPTWFLPCVFGAEILWLKIRKIKSKKSVVLCGMLCFLIGIFLSYRNIIWTVIRRVFIGSFYVMLGYAGPEMYRIKRKIGGCILLCIGILINIWLSIENGVVSIAGLTFGNKLIFTFNSLLGIAVIIQWFVLWNRENRFLEFCGRNTMIILCTHMFLIEILRLFDYKVINSAITEKGVAGEIILWLAVISLEIPIIYLINDKLSWMLGRQKQIKKGGLLTGSVSCIDFK